MTSYLIQKKWVDLQMFSQLVLLMVVTIMFTWYALFRQARSAVIKLMVLGLMMNLALKFSSIANSAMVVEKETIASLMNHFTPLLYGMIILPLFGSYFIKGKSDQQQQHQQNYVAPNAVSLDHQTILVPSQINVALEKMRIQIEKDKETRRDEHEQFKQMVLMNMNLQQNTRRRNEEHFICSHNQNNYTATHLYHRHHRHYDQEQQNSTPDILNPVYSSPILQRYPSNNSALLLPKNSFEFKSPRQRLDYCMSETKEKRNISNTTNPDRMIHTDNIGDQSMDSCKSIKNRSTVAEISGTNADNECESDWSEDRISLQFLTPSPSPVPPEEGYEINSFNNGVNSSDTDTNRKRLKVSANNVITEETKVKKRKIGNYKEEQYDYLDQDNDNKKQKKSN